jgi:hypothetical protein
MGLSYIVRHPSTAYTNAASVIMQLTAGATDAFTLHQFKLQSNVLTSSQAIVICQWGYYATKTSSGGTAATPNPLTKRNTVSAATAGYYATATLGTTLTVYGEFQWNLAAPWEDTRGLIPSKIEVPAAAVWALVLPNASGTPTISGEFLIEEF